MTLIDRLSGVRRTVGISMLFALAATPGFTQQVKTNWVEHWVTNAIEVNVPANRFVSEYHTNVIVRVHTNVVNVYATNILTCRVTNRFSIDAFHTNFVSAYQTNYKNLNVTNWTTMVVLKTNWVQQTVTNVAEVDLARIAPVERASARPNTTPAVPVVKAATDALIVQAIRGTKTTPSNQADVLLKAHWANRTEREVQVQQWRVQSQEGSILCFGQESEFHRNLPYGRYKVEVKARFESNTPLVTARGVLAVSAREVTLDQNSLAQR